jgi:hypothetical protein
MIIIIKKFSSTTLIYLVTCPIHLSSMIATNQWHSFRLECRRDILTIKSFRSHNSPGGDESLLAAIQSHHALFFRRQINHKVSPRTALALLGNSIALGYIGRCTPQDVELACLSRSSWCTYKCAAPLVSCMVISSSHLSLLSTLDSRCSGSPSSPSRCLRVRFMRRTCFASLAHNLLLSVSIPSGALARCLRLICIKLREATHSMPRWTHLSMIPPLSLPAQHVPLAKTFRTTGPLLCISRHAMGRSSAYLRWQMKDLPKMVA